VKTSMNNIIDISTKTMSEHGQYDYVFNNCKHFTKVLLSNIQKECVNLSYNVNWKEIYNYVKCHEPSPSPHFSTCVSWETFLNTINNPSDDDLLNHKATHIYVPWNAYLLLPFCKSTPSWLSLSIKA